MTSTIIRAVARATALGGLCLTLLAMPTSALGNPAPKPEKAKGMPNPAKTPQPKKSNSGDAATAPKQDISKTGLTKAQNGTFTGHFRGSGFEGTIRFVVRAGLMVDAQIEVINENIAFRIHPSGDLDSPNPGFIGGNELDFLRFSGSFIDAEQASGTVRGNLARQNMTGQWYVIRR